jgi:hypothetical protein
VRARFLAPVTAVIGPGAVGLTTTAATAAPAAAPAASGAKATASSTVNQTLVDVRTFVGSGRPADSRSRA